MTDPGSDFTSKVMGHLLSGLARTISSHWWIDRNLSCGVEGMGKQVARHVRVLSQEERIKDEWSSPTVLPLIDYLVNSHVSSETGILPLEATFGSQDAIYLNMPQGLNPSKRTHEFVRRLDEN